MNKILAQLSSKRLPGIFRAHVVIHGGTCVIKDLHNSGHARICCYYFRFNLFLNHFKVENSNRKRLSSRLMFVFYRCYLQTSMNANKEINAPIMTKNATIPTEVIFATVDQVTGNGHITKIIIHCTHYLEAAAGKKK